MSPADLARRAFWSEHPLGTLYAIAHGQWFGDRFVPCSRWSIKELRNFAAQLPPDVIRNLSGENHAT